MMNSLAVVEALLTVFSAMIPVLTGWAAWNIVATKNAVDGMLSTCGTAISVGCAIVLHALLCQAMLMAGVASPASVIFCDLIVMLVVLAVCVTQEASVPAEVVTNGKCSSIGKWIASIRLMPISHRLSWAAFGTIVLLLSIFVCVRANVSPMGDWDAWIIWNTKARLLYRAPEGWVEPLRLFDWWRHPDYPLTHSSSVARVWFWAGETRLAPILLGLQYPVLCTTLIISVVSQFRGMLLGVAAGMILLASPVYQETFWAQCADGPLAFFILASGAALIIGSRLLHRMHWWLLSAIAAGLATTIKNEGLVWWGILAFVVGVFSFFIPSNGAKRCRYLTWIGVSTLFLMMTLGTKFWIGAENDLLQSDRDWAMLLSDVNRHLEVIQTMASRWLGVLPDAAREPGGTNETQSVGLGAAAFLALIVIVVAGKIRTSRRLEVLTLTISLFMFASVCHIVFVLTPHDLSWHLFSAAHRVVAQMWPLAVLLCFLCGTDDQRGSFTEGTPAANSST